MFVWCLSLWLLLWLLLNCDRLVGWGGFSLSCGFELVLRLGWICLFVVHGFCYATWFVYLYLLLVIMWWILLGYGFEFVVLLLWDYVRVLMLLLWVWVIDDFGLSFVEAFLWGSGYLLLCLFLGCLGSCELSWCLVLCVKWLRLIVVGCEWFLLWSWMYVVCGVNVDSGTLFVCF